MHQNVNCYYLQVVELGQRSCDGEEETYSKVIMKAECEDLAVDLVQRVRKERSRR